MVTRRARTISTREVVEVRQDMLSAFGARYCAEVLMRTSSVVHVCYSSLYERLKDNGLKDKRLTELLHPNDVDHVRLEPPDTPKWFYSLLQPGDLIELHFDDSWWPVALRNVLDIEELFEVGGREWDTFDGSSCFVEATRVRPAWQLCGNDLTCCWCFPLEVVGMLRFDAAGRLTDRCSWNKASTSAPAEMYDTYDSRDSTPWGLRT